jgi:hypothetical protein
MRVASAALVIVRPPAPRGSTIARRAGVARMPASSVSRSASIRLEPEDFGKDEEAESASLFKLL